MPVHAYRTIESPAEGMYKEKGSKFFAFAFPVQSDSEIREHIASLQRKFFDARHHCYAWMLGADKKLSRAFDDGEPNHSAGDPILGQIRSKDLTNVLVVVVRYFGGTKLGVGGLISAYKLAAAEALGKAVITEREIRKSLTLHYEYPSTPEVMKLVKDYDLEIQEQVFEQNCVLRAGFKVKNEENLKERLELLKALGHINRAEGL